VCQTKMDIIVIIFCKWWNVIKGYIISVLNFL
jgi:hypothetical protein